MRLRPDQRYGLGQVADEIERPAEELGIDPGYRQIAYLAGLRLGKREFADQRGKAVHGELSRRDRGRAMPPADKLARGVMIHHLSIAARDPQQAAAVLA